MHVLSYCMQYIGRGISKLTLLQLGVVGMLVDLVDRDWAEQRETDRLAWLTGRNVGAASSWTRLILRMMGVANVIRTRPLRRVGSWTSQWLGLYCSGFKLLGTWRHWQHWWHSVEQPVRVSQPGDRGKHTVQIRLIRTLFPLPSDLHVVCTRKHRQDNASEPFHALTALTRMLCWWSFGYKLVMITKTNMSSQSQNRDKEYSVRL